jgi:hypothetical protein
MQSMLMCAPPFHAAALTEEDANMKLFVETLESHGVAYTFDIQNSFTEYLEELSEDDFNALSIEGHMSLFVTQLVSRLPQPESEAGESEKEVVSDDDAMVETESTTPSIAPTPAPAPAAGKKKKLWLSEDGTTSETESTLPSVAPTPAPTPAPAPAEAGTKKKFGFAW